MHISDGFLSGSVSLATGALSVAVVGLALARAGRSLDDKKIPLLGVTAAFVFAAQMLNFPVIPGASGHFMGAALTAILLGPLNACLIMAIVLLIQCLLFADGGLTALGANILNMGIIGGLASYGIFTAARTLLARFNKGFFIAAGLAAWCSIVVSASACALELALSGTVPLRVALPAMAGIHALIGIGEALITCTVLGAIVSVRPDLVPGVKTLKPNPASPNLASS